MAAVYYITLPTDETYTFFEVGCWYKSFNGITAKFSGNIESSSGWWSGTFAKDFFRLVTPSQWEKITSGTEELDRKLQEELDAYEPLTFPIKVKFKDGRYV